jgi:riboflavin kinase/FMN adenylyltransferase
LSAVEIVRDASACPRPPEGTVVTIGAYDGLHLGHRAVISEVCERAREGGHRSAMVTFDRHPAQVIRPESAPRLLIDPEQKLELLAGTDLDIVVVLHFDEARARESAEDFVRDVLVGCLNARQVVVGEDFHFGHRRGGNVALLTDMGQELGFEVTGHRLVGPDGRAARDDEQVSSTAIRRSLHDGHLEEANRMLGRAHEMRGPVVAGDRRGREIGFPTANVAIAEEMLMPAEGIYAGRLVRDDGEEVLPAAIYLGRRPTFYDEGAAVLLEVHVLDFDGDLYGERVAVRFEHLIRPDRRFDTVDELANQLALDCAAARRLLA